MKSADLKLNSAVAVELKKDASKYGMPMPEELGEILKQDDEARMRFEALKPGMQRYILHYVGTVKNSDKRLDRAFLLMENLKSSPKGKETFRKILGMPDRES